ncbi:hypothetical protein ACFE04_025965 [Oxalis oulophora]
MEGGAAAQIAPPPTNYIHNQMMISGRFCEDPTMARKRDLSYQNSNFQMQQRFSNPLVQTPRDDNWNPKLWGWDSVRFLAKPVDSPTLQLGNTTTTTTTTTTSDPKNKEESDRSHSKNSDNNERLNLNLGGSLDSVEEPVSRPNKRVRSGSPGNTSYPKCQVDNCKEDLSNAKDYHRRHKVCEVHSKSTKALVGKQMQRFCQQCSRFHPLLEFDEGKRSCRRRLAGHNRRRRKNQPEDVTSRLLNTANQDSNRNANLDIVNLLTVLAQAQGKIEERSNSGSSVPNKEQLIEILSKINSSPIPGDLASKLPNLGTSNQKSTVQPDLNLNGPASAPSTMDFLAVLSSTSTNQAAALNLNKRIVEELPSAGPERSSTSYQCSIDDMDYQVQQTQPKLPLQLFSSSPENDSPPKLASSRKYYSSDSSNPMDDRSPSSSPAVHKLFPMPEIRKPEKTPITREVNGKHQSSGLPLDLFKGSHRVPDRGSWQSPQYQAGYTSSSGSDHSPPSLNSDIQDRTRKITFKLFEKDPSQLPGALRAQVYNWLSNSPSEIESYIRPGCVVISIYVSMSSSAWEQLEENLLQRVDSLVQDSYSDFWRKSRFLVNTGRQLASHKDGKIRICKSWRSWSSPELYSVSPLAIVGNQEVSVLLRGRNLTNHGTRIHCTLDGGYVTKQVAGLTHEGTVYDELKLGGLKIQGESPGMLGRCFIEVENGFKGNSFPIIIADASICKELRLLETEIDLEATPRDTISEEQADGFSPPRSREEVFHFLNELGWLFQRKRALSLSVLDDGYSNFSLSRFKFLLVFSVEKDYCAVVKVLLDLLAEGILGVDAQCRESLDTLSEIQLLNRAVKRKCKKMADLLIRYTIMSKSDGSKKYMFLPNLSGPGGITPLHLAACTSGSEEMVDVLTSDPQEIGIFAWNTLVDENGQSPFAYAAMRNNHSYNKLVARKLADKQNSQVSVTIGMEIEGSQEKNKTAPQYNKDGKSCTKCAFAANKYQRRVFGTQGLLQRPYVHSMLAIAAVCVCVCLLARGLPNIGSVSPFKWEKLHYGTS